MCCYSENKFCMRYFPEWQTERTCPLLIVKAILLLIVAALWCSVSGVEEEGEWMGPRILQPEKALIVVGFMIICAFLSIIYTPWHHKLVPWCFKIIAIILYFGSLFFLFWEFHIAPQDGGLLPPAKQFRTNDSMFDLWTLNHTFLGLLFAAMFPFFWTLLIVIVWEVLELFVYGAGDEISTNAIADVVVALIAWWVIMLIYSRKCIPLISSRCAVETKESAQENHEQVANANDEYETYGAHL